MKLTVEDIIMVFLIATVVSTIVGLLIVWLHGRGWL